jgi:hypothetical protein
MFQFILGAGLAAFILGGLSERTIEQQQPLTDLAQAAALGVIFALSARARRWAILPRFVLVLPSFLIFLTILTDRRPPMPFFVAFLVAGFYALFITAFATAVADRTGQGAGEPKSPE